MDSDKVFVIEDELKKLPAKPGVYLMHDRNDDLLYVGKAIRLKNRVRQYFQSDKNKTAKIREMVSRIAWFEYIVTDSELEALVLECNLIKENRPPYNTMLMDDKAYPFIRVTVEETYPRVMVAREMKKDKSRYFGPYTSGYAVKETLELLHRIYKIRTCTRVLPRDTGKERACLNYHMGLCSAPCQGQVAAEEYRGRIDGIMRFLNGDSRQLEKEISAKMMKASDDLDFEEAIKQRDLLNAVKHIAQKQKITDSVSRTDRDVIGCAVEKDEAVVQVFFVRDGKLTGRDHFHMECEEGTSDREILASFIPQFYGGTPFIPRELLIREDIADRELIEAWLTKEKGKKVSILIPQRGEKEKLLDLAVRNAKMVLEKDREKLKREELRTRGAVNELETLLGLEGLKRMEAFDISNISGFESVGSMVVFTDGKPKKNDYRKFRIRTVTGPDDYASMEEVLGRRFRHGLSGDLSGGFQIFPDLILMDGGKGQVHSAEKVLEELHLFIPVCGMVKDDHHNTRGLYYHDRELPIDTHSEAFHLITRIQDEAHRFAISYHRGLHIQNAIHSVLEDIPGVGEKRRKALMRAYGSIDEMRSASVEDLRGIDGFNLRAAEEVYAYLHRDETAGESGIRQKDIYTKEKNS